MKNEFKHFIKTGIEWADSNPNPDREAAIQSLIEACKNFKKGFDNGFSNALNTIEARDKIFEVLEKLC